MIQPNLMIGDINIAVETKSCHCPTYKYNIYTVNLIASSLHKLQPHLKTHIALTGLKINLDNSNAQ